MYPVSEAYLDKIKDNERYFTANIVISHSQGKLEIGDNELVQGSLKLSQASQSSDEFTIGGVVAKDLQFEILNKDEYKDIPFEGAIISPSIGLEIEENRQEETYFLQAPYPAEFVEGDFKYEYVPLGIFIVDEVIRSTNVIKIKALDYMIELDKPYSYSKLQYPATLKQIFLNICDECNVLPGKFDNLNMDYIVKEKPSDTVTFRDVLSCVAQLNGSFSQFERDGKLSLKWYSKDDNSPTYDGSNRFDFLPQDHVVWIKGIMCKVTIPSDTEGEEDEEVVYLTGDGEYAIDLTDNFLLQDNHSTILPSIFDKVSTVKFVPYSSNWQGDPALDVGDIITQVSEEGTTYETIVTNSTYVYRGKSILEGKGLPTKAQGYKGTTAKRIENVKREMDKKYSKKMGNLEIAQNNATEILTNMLGGYLTIDKENGIIYITDNPDLSLSRKVWKWGTGGFGYSENGIDGPYTTAITADGSIVAHLVSAGIITAEMVKVGGSGNDGVLTVKDSDDKDLVILDHRGVTLANGAKMIGGSGVISVLSYQSSGLLKGYQEVGEWNMGGFYNQEMATISVFVPDNFVITKGTIYIKSLPTHVLESQSIPLGYYHAKNLKLYKVASNADGEITYMGENQGYTVTFGEDGADDITRDVIGSSTFSPKGKGVQVYKGDITNVLNPTGRTTFAVKSTDGEPTSLPINGGGLQFEVYIEGYKS